MDFEYPMSGKWLQVLGEIAPKVSRVLGILSPDNRARWSGYFGVLEAAAPSLAMQVIPAGVRDAPEIERAVAALARSPPSGLLVLPDATAAVHQRLIIGLATRHRLPAVYPYGYYA